MTQNKHKRSPILSNFAILEVPRSAKWCDALHHEAVRSAGIPVVIRGRLVRRWGNHYGFSQQFEIDVESVEEPVEDEGWR